MHMVQIVRKRTQICIITQVSAMFIFWHSSCIQTRILKATFFSKNRLIKEKMKFVIKLYLSIFNIKIYTKFEKWNIQNDYNRYVHNPQLRTMILCIYWFSVTAMPIFIILYIIQSPLNAGRTHKIDTGFIMIYHVD